MGELDPARIQTIHQSCGHPGVKRTHYFIKLVSPEVSKAAVREVGRECEECQFINPAPVSWKASRLDVCENWSRVGMDVTYLEGRHYLTLIDCGPSWFAIWRLLLCQVSASIVQQLETVFYERRAPVELLTDNATTFSGETFSKFTKHWGVQIRFRCAYIPAGNGIVERSHRTIKRIATRSQCSVMEAVNWYNVTPKDGVLASAAPDNVIYSYLARIKGIDIILPPEDAGLSSYELGDSVWVKIPLGQCTTQFGKGTITGLYSPHSVLVDGTPHHVKDVRPLRGVDTTYCSITSSEDKAPMLYLMRENPAKSESDHSDHGLHRPRDTYEDDDIAESVPLRRSSRLKRPAPHCTVCDSQIREEYECNGRNVPGTSKHALTCLACRVKARNRYGCFKRYM